MAKELDFKQGEYKEAVDYFKQKINLPTKKWNDLEGAMHTRAFTVAGAMREDILCDFRNAVDKAISKGESLQQFRDRFYQIAGKWSEADENFKEKMERPKYGAWRSKVIYQTNVITAAAAAKERQARALPDVFTHAKYVCMMLPGSREEHKAWNGTVLPVNHPWWEKHSPPNGFGCLCQKEFISKYEMEAGMEKVTKAPTAPDDTTNIGENWDYSIGDADLGKFQKDEAKEEWKNSPQKNLWEKTDIDLPKGANPMGTPKKTPYTEDIGEFKTTFQKRIEEEFNDDENAYVGKDYMTYNVKIKGCTYPLYINPELVGTHFLKKGSKTEWKPQRTKLINYFIETLKNPSAMKMEFDKSSSGKISISTVFVGLFQNGKTKKPMKLVFRATNGHLQLWTFYRDDGIQI